MRLHRINDLKIELPPLQQEVYKWVCAVMEGSPYPSRPTRVIVRQVLIFSIPEKPCSYDARWMGSNHPLERISSLHFGYPESLMNELPALKALCLSVELPGQSSSFVVPIVVGNQNKRRISRIVARELSGLRKAPIPEDPPRTSDNTCYVDPGKAE